MTHLTETGFPHTTDPAPIRTDYVQTIADAVGDNAFRQAMQSVLALQNTACTLRQRAAHDLQLADALDAQARRLDSAARGAKGREAK